MSFSNCKYCNGTGKRKCSMCKGNTNALMYPRSTKTCENCNGTKRETCIFCKGMGRIHGRL